MKLGKIPENAFEDYRYQVIFEAYKWDPLVSDQSTIADHALLLSREEANDLIEAAEKLALETKNLEGELLKRLDLAKDLNLPRKVVKELKRLNNYDENANVRLMRFDFHPTAKGWAVSEVNSDVPAGFAEASILPVIALPYFEGYEPGYHAGECLYQAFLKRVKPGGTLAFVHATAYSDDSQIMHYLSDYFSKGGFKTYLAGPDLIEGKNGKAFLNLGGELHALDGLFKYFPVEWLEYLPRKADRKIYYHNNLVSCNHPVSVLCQSKRLPLVWNKLDVEVTAWKKYLPKTVDPRDIKNDPEGWIYKPVWGRVGDSITIKEAISEKEMKSIEKVAQKQHKQWVAQKRFASMPLPNEDGNPLHLCVGVFVIDGKCAGFYGRASHYPRIDEKAIDIPILVEKEETRNGKN